MCCSRRTRSGSSAATTTSTGSTWRTRSRRWSSGRGNRCRTTGRRRTPTSSQRQHREDDVSTNPLSILKPSVNNLSTRIFVRAAGLDFEELDVWGKKSTPEFLAKDPADLTPLLEEEGLAKGSLWESCAIMQYLCNKHGLTELYPTDPAERAMVDSAMFYLIGTLYPLLTRATYPALGFGQYPGEVGSSDADDEAKASAQ